VIAAASEKMLEQNGFYLRLHYTSTKQKEEIVALQQTISDLKKESESLKEQNETYRYESIRICVGRVPLMYCIPNREIIDRSIAKDPQQPALGQGTGLHQGLRTYSLANPPPNPTLQEQEEHSDIHYWHKGEFRTEFNSRKKKGETDGHASSVRTKRKPGRPPKSSTEDPDDHSAHFYLEYHDGTPVSREDIADLSQFARSTWEDLNDAKLAPVSFNKMSRLAWDYFWRCTVAKFPFLLLFEGGQWKLRHWSTQSYSSWAGNRGIRPVKPKTEVLNDPKLIRDDDDDQETEDPRPEEIQENDYVPFSDVVQVRLSHSDDLLSQLHRSGSPQTHLQPTHR
jgi:hypothetical protein